MLKKLLPLFLVILASVPAEGAELVIAEDGQCDYQIVIPDQAHDEVVADWLLATAKLMQTAFEKNNFKVDVVKESAKAPDKPGIYLGATEFAKKNGVNLEQYNDWTYVQKTVGNNLIIAGNDKKDPIRTIRRRNIPLALLGTVKGVCDFLREYAGVRFLFLNMDNNLYARRADGSNAFDKDGTLNVDTRSIAFSPAEKIAIAQDLDIQKTPMSRANYDYAHETFYHIANNFFPLLSFVLGSDINWYEVIPPAEYAEAHPEYFALKSDGTRACDLKLPFDYQMEYCVTNKGVQDLMYQAIEKLIANGEKTIELHTMDSYRLCRCNCEECNKFFGIKAENWEQIRARGSSGKLWQAYFEITERVRENYPDVKIVLLNYQDTPANESAIKKFPPNVIVKIQFASQNDFDELKGVEFPAGICGFEETFTGFGQAGPYLPERTPEHMAEVVQAMKRNNVKWSMRDGALGYVRGMQAPAYYVYGRMMDDPSADWQAIYNEFCTAAFGNSAHQMTRFFDLLHMQIAIYSDFYGVMMPAWSRKYSRSTYHDSKWHVMQMYTPEYCANADALLTSAEKLAKNPDVKARLHLIRIEFDYAKKMSRIFHLQNAWLVDPTNANLYPLLDAIDDWHAYLKELAGGVGSFKPLDDWPEMRPFSGHTYAHAALENQGYQQQWNKTCLNWDTNAIRVGIPIVNQRYKVARVEEAPGIDSNAWEDVPVTYFKDRSGMPFANVRTTMKILRDKNNLYVRIESLYPSRHPEDMWKKEPDGDIFTQDEYVELGMMPPNSGGKIYRIAVNPVEGSRYDSVFTPDSRNRMTEDIKWNGKWKSACKTSLEKGRWNLNSRVWTAWFQIPFSDFGAKTPTVGEVWNFNAARKRTGQYMFWNDASILTDVNTLGEIVF